MNENMRTPPRMRTITEASREAGISAHAIRQWIKGGQIPAVYAGTKALVNLDRLLDFLNGGAVNE